jgi:transposase
LVDTNLAGRILPRRISVSQRKRRKFTAEQKAEAVRVAQELGNVAKAARDLDVVESCLARWIEQSEKDAGRGSPEALTTDERAELQRLRREVRILEQERSFLKKAAAYFAGDTINERHSN